MTTRNDGVAGLVPSYRSPAESWVSRVLEDRLIGHTSPKPSSPVFVRMRATVPKALYLNYSASLEFARALAPDCFTPMVLADGASTLFTILVFLLADSRPVSAHRLVKSVIPSMIMQANWRFYGQLQLQQRQDESPAGVLFWKTVTDSRALALFGRRLARCFPLVRARRMMIDQNGAEVSAYIDPGQGSAPLLRFRGRTSECNAVPEVLQESFADFLQHARWIIDQRLSVCAHATDAVIQDMHLSMDGLTVKAVEPEEVEIPALRPFVETPETPVSCFLAEGMEVWLDAIYAVPRSGGSVRLG